ncbi:S-layer homology domain-containing protein, partial [Arthrobacter sp. efr-133-TYG-104]|uniref:S-layer homology domain-containing protein n=1 Tax=Arthrobacter sp. efr-133-TYG-104 TaxID=3040324 RepID=UPI0033067611
MLRGVMVRALVCLALVIAGISTFPLVAEAAPGGKSLSAPASPVRMATTRMATTSMSSASFTDVPPGAQFFTEIQWLAAQGISTGWIMPDNSKQYRPLLPVARDAMAAFMYRLAGSPAFTAPQNSPFTDITPSTKFYKEITWLASTGISTGYVESDKSKTYRPADSVGRDAMAAFMYRLAGSPAFT